MEALGPVLILVSIPLLFRWIPQNRLYGFRNAATLGGKSVWYDVNASAARHFVALGLLMVLLEFTLPVAIRTQTLWWVVVTALPVVIVANWRTANRLARERTGAR